MNNNLLGMLQGLMQNPVQTLLSRNLNIPQNIAGNPQAIIQHLLSTGQISQNQVNQAMMMRNNPVYRGLFGG